MLTVEMAASAETVEMAEQLVHPYPNLSFKPTSAVEQMKTLQL
jgi:hypothetical protein